MKYTYKTWKEEGATASDGSRKFDNNYKIKIRMKDNPSITKFYKYDNGHNIKLGGKKAKFPFSNPKNDYKVKIRIKGFIKPFVMKIYKYNNGHNIKLGVQKAKISFSNPEKEVENYSFRNVHDLTYTAVQSLLDNYLECTRGDRKYAKKLLNSIPAAFLRDENIRKAYERIIDDLVEPYSIKKLSNNKLKISDKEKIAEKRQILVKKYINPRIENINSYLIKNKCLFDGLAFYSLSADDTALYNKAKEEIDRKEREAALSRALEERSATEEARHKQATSSHHDPVVGE